MVQQNEQLANFLSSIEGGGKAKAQVKFRAK